MTLDVARFKPTPAPWFSPTVEYRGWGAAAFRDLSTVVEGDVEVTVDERGDSSIEMFVRKVYPDEPLSVGLLRLGNPGAFNGRTELAVTLPDGLFYSPSCLLIHMTNLDSRGGQQPTLSFHASRAQFDAADSGQPAYWVLPLVNFLSSFVPHHEPALDRHPLRIFPTPLVPAGLAEREAKPADIDANKRNRLIAFEFNGEPAFIEALPDYDERRNRLLTGAESATVTAVMVGSVGNLATDDAERVDRWFPMDLLPILGLATGNEVGSSWVEFRDHGGGLVRRLHYTSATPSFAKERGAIDEGVHHGTGQLLTAALKSEALGRLPMQATLKHIVRGGLPCLSLEDQLTHLFRALDGLCQEAGLAKGQRPNAVLDRERANQVESIVKTAAKELDRIAKNAEDEGQNQDEAAIRRIANNVQSSLNVKPGFGKQVVALLDQLDFPDAEIVARYYEEHPRSDGKRWPDVLSAYRGMIMHHGFIDFQSDAVSIHDAWTIRCHLRDLLTRIVLKRLGYDGTYQPQVMNGLKNEPVNWVTPDLPPARLGYK